MGTHGASSGELGRGQSSIVRTVPLVPFCCSVSVRPHYAGRTRSSADTATCGDTLLGTMVGVGSNNVCFRLCVSSRLSLGTGVRISNRQCRA
eukprot:2745701-Prymnesium_polylepis.1